MEKRHSLYIIALLLAISIVLTVINSIWIQNNITHIPPPWDSSWYIYMGLNDYDTLWNGNYLLFLKTFIMQDPYHAPLFPLPGIVFTRIFGPDIHYAYYSNCLYLFILFSAVFFTSRRLAGVKAGLLSVFFIATFPATIAYSRDYLSEFPLASLTALSYLYFLRSDSFQDRKAAILFGIFSGLSFLIKTLGIFFFVMPFFYAAYLFFKTRYSKETRRNIIYAFLAAVIIASVYYLPNYKDILNYFFHYGLGEGSKNYNMGIPGILSLQYWTNYLTYIALAGISPGFLFVFVASMLAYLFSKGEKCTRDYLFIWLWFICGYVLLSSLPSKGGERYALPILPPLAILMSTHIARISLKPLKYSIISLAILLGVINYTYQTASNRCRYQPYSFSNIPLLEAVHTNCVMQKAISLPHDKVWDVEQILDALDKMNQGRYMPVHVLIAFDHHFLNINTLYLYQKINKLKGISHINYVFERLPNNSVAEDEIRKIMERNQFIITKEGFQGPVFTNMNNNIVKNTLKDRTPVNLFAMSDGSEVFLYSD
jgi:4-amino-4-deoxy-L-arabinose transferase-like glycosyltransferase